MTDAGILSEDKLFATLDPTTRAMNLPNGEKILLTDTVGFIRKLPHNLIEAFKSTLEEAKYADIIVHVVDASSPDRDIQMDVVYKTLKELEVGDKPVVTCLTSVISLKMGIRKRRFYGILRQMKRHIFPHVPEAALQILKQFWKRLSGRAVCIWYRPLHTPMPEKSSRSAHRDSLSKKNTQKTELKWKRMCRKHCIRSFNSSCFATKSLRKGEMRKSLNQRFSHNRIVPQASQFWIYRRTE